ncbi:MAG: hypothetical protein COA79_17065 [Planctomycetota bacterium]|nr:MAG: hypothetical protein COA79_17065 [Planctomycetota bacterium]
MINIKIASSDDKVKWNEFVLSHPQGSYCHLYEWKNILKESYNLSSLYLMALDGNNITAVLPITQIKNIKLKKMGVSVAFNGYGGVLQLTKPENKSWEDLFSEFIFKNTKTTQLELRHLGNQYDSKEKVQEVSMILSIPENNEILWKSIGSKRRGQIRKAEKAGVHILENDDINGFYDVYARNVGRLGTPVHKKLFFQKIKEHFKERSLFLTANRENTTIGGMLIIDYQLTSANPFASTLQDYNKYCPNLLMYWHAIKRAQNNGFKFFDMGRSQMESGTFNFKKQWGSTPYIIQNHILSKDTENLNTNVMIYRSEAMQKLSAIWSRIPFTVQKIVGPHIRKYLP